MTDTPKKFGILKDPWREPPKANPEPPPRAKAAEAAANLNPQSEDIQNERHATLVLGNYGGITVDGLRSPQEAAARVLAFCVDNLKDIEENLIYYGVLVHELPANFTPVSPFYIQRSDGWTLAVPDVADRETGFMALIQAFLNLWEVPSIRKTLIKYQIRPYKI